MDCMAGCHAQHQQTAFAKKKSHDAMFFVNTDKRRQDAEANVRRQGMGSPEPWPYSGSGSIEADIAPLERASSRSAPKAWI